MKIQKQAKQLGLVLALVVGGALGLKAAENSGLWGSEYPVEAGCSSGGCLSDYCIKDTCRDCEYTPIGAACEPDTVDCTRNYSSHCDIHCSCPSGF